ncbi:MAG: hypothetical protein A3D49_00035 [Candidatus Zambryskibacteria bacterium RIFCSPHIGHO2_02_FULL_43_37]|uniref:DUF4015 domain-containing protein n=2 Tax=Parcubacteria group TaxID=1794811 RepID=A0A1F8DTT6_9BACT|nr:MAG: hypothetical protein A2755_01535 [Candidatus Wolfebacteria bacterium RIFCSPHIGHO2_01_FULL_48_22]OHA97068.1 MAG: hypothetical protein A3D49_00035 [Candidatus Zambryskibacteria bacterium RIFCSPHIGHO2_02_FULL_43_37]OHB07568.1 MAG: hypothetical protein A2944_01675 [Candidatus Zambryskibacteria bacterium RIFCSPLOWO2_01_FULL_52_12]
MAQWRNVLVWAGGVVLLFIFLTAAAAPRFMEIKYRSPLAEERFASAVAESSSGVEVVHLPTPEPLKALYMTSCVAGTPSWRNELKSLIETSELNAVVIDVKDFTGRIAFLNNFPKGPDQRGCTVSDLKEFVAALHSSGIYVIGRISVFQDASYSRLFPELAVENKNGGGIWLDHKGLSFIDVGAKPYWDYIVQISKDAYALGFDELNYDYVRYPSDGDMENISYVWSSASSTRADTLESFFTYLDDKLSDTGVVTSVDLFGMTMTVPHDMGIGQVFEKALPHFDYVSPMVYPSHYPATWGGFANPAEHPYDVVHIAMSEGKRREAIFNISMGLATSTPSKLRPWLQDFNLGATYGPDKVRAQIQATYDSGLTSWMLWSAANKYTKDALLPE